MPRCCGFSYGTTMWGYVSQKILRQVHSNDVRLFSIDSSRFQHIFLLVFFGGDSLLGWFIFWHQPEVIFSSLRAKESSKISTRFFPPCVYTRPFKRHSVIDIFLCLLWYGVKSEGDILCVFWIPFGSLNLTLSFKQHSQPKTSHLILLQFSLPVITVTLEASWIAKVAKIMIYISLPFSQFSQWLLEKCFFFGL